jgi:hypothetical protein
MCEEYPIEVPASFIALFVDLESQKPNASRDVVAARYERCEDLAARLTKTAQSMLVRLGIAEVDVLVRCSMGLESEHMLTQLEALWVVRRAAELLDWDIPALNAAL